MQRTYQQPMYQRLEPKTEWTGGRITDTDTLSLSEAAAMATKHAHTEITVQDILRAAGRGEISLSAIVHRDARLQKYDGGIYCNKGRKTENMIPKGAIPTLPVSACSQLANAGRASWRGIDGYEMVDDEWLRFEIATLTDDEPDIETNIEDCRISGHAIHALADAFLDPPDVDKGRSQPAPATIDWKPFNAACFIARTEESPDEIVGWFDYVMDAKDWFEESIVTPIEAALLLCQLNPNDDPNHDPNHDDLKPEGHDNGETSAREFIKLRRAFWGAQESTKEQRNLEQWIELAESRGLKYHSWIKKYRAAVAALMPGQMGIGLASAVQEKKPIAQISPESVGKEPRTAMGRVALKAAREIERESGKRANKRDIYKRLVSWAKDSIHISHEECRFWFDLEASEIMWETSKGDSKKFTYDALGDTLKSWYRS